MLDPPREHISVPILPRPAAPGLGLNLPRSLFGWTCIAAATALWIYAVVIAVVFKRLAPSAALDSLAAWAAVPGQLGAFALVGVLLLSPGRLARGARGPWVWVLLFIVLNTVSAYFWNEVRPSGASREVFSVADLLYVADYWMLTIAFGLWFLRAGGSFRKPQVWLDALTMVAVLLLGLWSFFLGPAAGSGTVRSISFGAIAAYSTAVVWMMSAAGLLCLQMPGYRWGLAPLLVIAGGLLDAVWEIMWMASWLTDRDVVGPFYNYGDVLCFAAICSAVAATQFEGTRLPDTPNPERRMDGFLPLLAVLVAIAVLSVSVASPRPWDAFMLNCLVGGCALLLVARQHSARKELRAVNRELARREADARLIELVRRSADLILVVSAGGRVTFASPAAESLLGMRAEDIQSSAVEQLFGAEHEAALAQLLGRAARRSAAVGTELRVQLPGRPLRVYKLSAINRLANELIQGVVLTLTDVTEQRLLEREVIDVASRERVRLSGEIHDGLGQELVGIAMLLHGVATSRQHDGALIKAQLQDVVTQINHVVGSARDLARGLSPLGVARGSLSGALKRLVPDAHSPVSVELDIDAAFEDRVIEDFRADHLYRIAQEAVSNAMRHSGGSRIRIELRREDCTAMLCISDDGRGFDHPRGDHPGLGLRLMEYRARIMGGALHLEHARGLGTRVKVEVPIAGTGGARRAD